MPLPSISPTLPPPKRSKPKMRWVLLFSAAIMLSFTLMVIYQNIYTYQQNITESEAGAERLLHTLSDHAELTLLGTDQLLQRAVEREYWNALFGGNLLAHIKQNFKTWLDEAPQLVAMAQIDAKGEVLVAAHKPDFDNWIDYTHTLAEEGLFTYLQDADDKQVFIGQLTTLDKKSLIVLSRRYNTLSGEFGGVVVAALNPDYFTRFYKDVATGMHPTMALTLETGAPLVTLTDASGDANIMLQRLQREWQIKKDGAPSLRKSEMVEGRLTIGVLKPLQNFKLLVMLALDEEDILSRWRLERKKDFGFLCLFIIFGSVLSFFSMAMAKQIERAEESEGAAILASQAKSDFLANMSHELRTPLNAIIGFSEMINTGYFGALNAKQKERIHDIHLCGTHLLQLISDILEFSKGDAGKLELVEEKMDAGAIIDETVRILETKIKIKGIELTQSIEPNLPPIWADKRKIRQILLNLLTNAIKFTPNSGQIKITAMLDPQGGLNLIVSDTGVGIAEEDIPKALSVFGQVHRNKSHEGTGLGLPLCKMYAEMHGGRLTISSKVNEGTAVRVLLPHQRTLAKQAMASKP